MAKCLTLLCALLASTEISVNGNVQNRLATVFREFEHRYTGSEYKDELFKYRLFIPTVDKKDEGVPILLWLHGYGEYGQDNLIHLRWLDRVLTDLDEPKKFQFFVLAVQCPRTNPTWFRSMDRSGHSHVDDMGEVAIDVLRTIMKKYPIDPNRVYVAGISSGGTGSWEIVRRFPQMFAAMSSMAGAPSSKSGLGKLTNIPIWAFNNDADPGSSTARIQRAVDEINRQGGVARLTIERGSEHDCWTAAFVKNGLMDWMLAQRRGATIGRSGTAGQ